MWKLLLAYATLNVKMKLLHVASIAWTLGRGSAQYVLQDDYMTGGFFGKFTFWNTSDTTPDTSVQYVSFEEAQDMLMIVNNPDNIQLRVDSVNIAPQGRSSIRITSNDVYQSGLVIVDIEHMPGGVCGTWPAFWMVGPNWPYDGEIGETLFNATRLQR